MQTVLRYKNSLEKCFSLLHLEYLKKNSEFLIFVLQSKDKGKLRNRRNMYPDMLADVHTEKQF